MTTESTEHTEFFAETYSVTSVTSVVGKLLSLRRRTLQRPEGFISQKLDLGGTKGLAGIRGLMTTESTEHTEFFAETYSVSSVTSVVGKLLSLRRSTLQGPEGFIAQKLDLGGTKGLAGIRGLMTTESTEHTEFFAETYSVSSVTSVVGKLLSLRRSTLQGPEGFIVQKLDLGWQSDHLQKKVLMENRAGQKKSVALHFVRIFQRFKAFALELHRVANEGRLSAILRKMQKSLCP